MISSQTGIQLITSAGSKPKSRKKKLDFTKRRNKRKIVPLKSGLLVSNLRIIRNGIFLSCQTSPAQETVQIPRKINELKGG